jgi:uncharacterized membrane protein (Fun14 family)
MSQDKDLPAPEGVPSTAPRWRFRLIVALLGVVAIAVVARAARGTPETRTQEAAQQRSASGQPAGLVPGTGPTGEPQTTPPPEEKDTLDVVLPFVSEGGIMMILGLLLGMITRSFLKVMFLFMILGFVGLQYMNYKGVITVNWGAMKDFVLNMVPKGASLSQIVQQKLPSLGAFGLGYLLGLKRG